MKRNIASPMIGVVFFALIAIAGYAAAIRGQDFLENLILGVIATGITAFFLYRVFKPSQRTNPEILEQTLMEVAAVTELPVIEDPISILLKKDEICHFQSEAQVVLIKNQVVGYTGGTTGISVRVAKGFSIRSGGSRGAPVRQNIAYTYPGIFSMTNQRIIMSGEKGYEYPLSKLTSITPYNGYSGITLQFGKFSVSMILDDAYWIPKIYDLIQGSKNMS